jgi:hypothetical protein
MSYVSKTGFSLLQEFTCKQAQRQDEEPSCIYLPICQRRISIACHHWCGRSWRFLESVAELSDASVSQRGNLARVEMGNGAVIRNAAADEEPPIEGFWIRLFAEVSLGGCLDAIPRRYQILSANLVVGKS